MLLEKKIQEASQEEKKIIGEDVTNIDPDIIEFASYYMKGVFSINKDLPYNEQFPSMSELDNRIILSMENLKKLPNYPPHVFTNSSDTPNSTIQLIMDITHMIEFILTIIEDLNTSTTPQMDTKVVNYASAVKAGLSNTSFNSPAVNTFALTPVTPDTPLNITRQPTELEMAWDKIIYSRTSDTRKKI